MPDIIITPSSGIIDFFPVSARVGRIDGSGNTINIVNPSGFVAVSGSGLSINTVSPNATLHTYSATSGATLFNLEGTNGSLFSVVDNLSGSLMSVNNNAGLPVFEVFSDDRVVAGRFGQNDFVMTSGGNVGIGTASPSSKFHVVGTSTFGGDISSTGSFIAGSGSASNPSFEFIGDVDTGMFSPAVNTIALSTSGVERIRIDNIGNVGIGNSPQNGFKLDVQGASVLRGQMNIGGGIVGQSTDFTAIRYSLSNTINSNSYSYVCNGGGSFGVGFAAPSGRVSISGGVAIGSNYNVTPPNNGLIVEGNVGIGTITPSGQLHVNGSGIFNSGIYVNNIGITGNMVFATNTSGNLIIKPNGDGALQADDGGNSRGLYSVDLQRSRASVSGVAAGDYSVVAGGNNNRAGGPGCTVAGGTNNTCDSNSYNTIGGGFGNTAVGGSSTIAGGVLNTASGYLSTIGGGESNTSSAYRSTVSGGQSNTASGYYSVVSGGKNNTASNLYSTVSGGINNTASSYRSTVGGGTNNTSSGDRSVIGGGESNTSSGTWSTVGGGGSNTASNNYATVAGGYTNNASESTSTVGGGAFNTASAYMSTVSGGKNNTASGIASTVGGGGHNLSSGVASTITGGMEGVSHQHGEEARSSGKFVDNGDAQIRKLLMRGKTTIANNTVLLTLDGALETVPSNNSVLSHNRYDPNDSTKQYTWLYNIKVIARNLSSAAPESAAYKFEGILESSSSAGVILLGNTKTVIYEDNADFDCNIYEYNTASGSINDGLYIEVSNSVYTQDEDIYWLAYVEILEIGITEYENSVYY